MVFVKEESEENTSGGTRKPGLMKMKEERRDLKEVDEKYQDQKDHDVEEKS
ncbi:hypothetical protein cypCar_00042442, partial [Cyprinus carpio]